MPVPIFQIEVLALREALYLFIDTSTLVMPRSPVYHPSQNRLTPRTVTDFHCSRPLSLFPEGFDANFAIVHIGHVLFYLEYLFD